MKTLRVIICAVFVLCCGFIFNACALKKDFSESNIVIGENQFVYDAKAHAVEIDYKGVDVEVTYALENNKNNFKPLKSLKLVNAGTYNLYYRLSARGYNSYTSNGTVELTIKPRDVVVTIEDCNLVRSFQSEIFLGHSVDGEIPGAPINLQFDFGYDFDRNNLELGETYKITCSTNNRNYNLIANEATLTVVDYIQINKGNGTVEYFSDLQEAVNAAEVNDTITLNENIYLNEGIEVDKSVVIDGQGAYSVAAVDITFQGTEYAGNPLSSVFNVFNRNVELTLKNLTVDGAQVARCVSVFHGKLNIDGATITNGRKTDSWRSGGVYVTNDSSFVMTSGNIINNDSNDYEYTGFCADLWVGANAVGSFVSITGGNVGNVFVNSNSYSAVGAGKFTFDGGKEGKIHSIYVEYDAGYGAVFEYVSGNIDFLMISLPSEDGVWGVYQEVTPVEGITYIGGKLDYTND